MTIPAEKVLNKIQELVIENSDSVLNFDQEQGEAEKLLEQQKKHLTVIYVVVLYRLVLYLALFYV